MTRDDLSTEAFCFLASCLRAQAGSPLPRFVLSKPSLLLRYLFSSSLGARIADHNDFPSGVSSFPSLLSPPLPLDRGIMAWWPASLLLSSP